METITSTFGFKLTGVFYEVGWDPQDPMESKENFDEPWEFEQYRFGAIVDGLQNVENRASQLPPNSPHSREMQDVYNEMYSWGQYWRLIFNQF